MKLLTSGPVNKDFSDGELVNWHIEVFNNSNETATTVLTVYALLGLTPPVEIGSTFGEINPGQYVFFNIAIDPNQYEHTLPVIEVANDDILITLYGRNKDRKQITGAVYRFSELIEIDGVVTKKTDKKK